MASFTKAGVISQGMYRPARCLRNRERIEEARADERVAPRRRATADVTSTPVMSAM
jgi:hypothetical protein